ncbi:Acyl carrier protein (ACP) [Mycoplasmopsis edwardii]|uniref:Acyl carrier protein (ACP) n=1 Tax=Mycoplasmopsis edwardii TaxID=53558 RepID=A0A3B0PQB9_9BACT|nr:phosphopantetheine-binding protein [Mycoplasmopsis edwardii]SYV96935.1 Acyl carrier protein (ACP) [Mycoplasmopsis edwardii]
MKNIKQQVLDNFTRVARKKVTENDDIKALNIDSLDLAEIIVLAEEEFNISISDEELMSLVLVSDVIKLIKSKHE